MSKHYLRVEIELPDGAEPTWPFWEGLVLGAITNAYGKPENRERRESALRWTWRVAGRQAPIGVSITRESTDG